jgi:hypothetical protein
MVSVIGISFFPLFPEKSIMTYIMIYIFVYDIMVDQCLSVRERVFLPLTQFGRAFFFPMNVPLLLSRVRLAHPHPRRSSHLTYLVPRSPDGQFFRLVPCPRTSPYSTYLPGENERFGPYLQRSFQAGGKVGPALLTITKVCLSFMVEVLLYGRACPTPSNLFSDRIFRRYTLA